MGSLALFAALSVLGAWAGPRDGALEGALVRPPAVAGGFYPADAGALRAEVDRRLERGLGPKPKGRVLALLVPHAGMQFSGEAAATAYDAVDPADVETVLMVGTAHYMPVDGAALYPGAYATPLGRVEYDAGLAAALLAASARIRAFPQAHQREHSIEVNVPFVQRRFPKARLVALVMNAGDLQTQEEIGRALAMAVAGRKALLVASSDLSHYPPAAVADRVDPTTLRALASLDPEFFFAANRLLMGRGLPELKCTYCGEGGVTAVLTAAGLLGANRAALLKRYNSGDSLSHDYRAVVGYAAVAFLKEPKAPPRAPYALTPEERGLLIKEARESLRRQLAGEPLAEPELSARPAFNLPAAVFVTLEGARGLRGCVGSTKPLGTLLEAVRRFAVEAGFHDSRFPPLQAAELAGLNIEISILSPLRPIQDASFIRSREEGVTVERDGHFGLFLPQVWDLIPDKKDFLAELCSQKAGLPRACASDPKTKLSVFTVESFKR